MKKKISTVFVCIIALLFLSFSGIRALVKEDLTITVTKSERVTKSSGKSLNSKYLIYTIKEDKSTEVFENTDCLWYLKWNSADFYQQLETGKTYKVRVIGWRIPILSMYRNVVKIE